MTSRFSNNLANNSSTGSPHSPKALACSHRQRCEPGSVAEILGNVTVAEDVSEPPPLVWAYWRIAFVRPVPRFRRNGAVDVFFIESPLPSGGPAVGAVINTVRLSNSGLAVLRCDFEVAFWILPVSCGEVISGASLDLASLCTCVDTANPLRGCSGRLTDKFVWIWPRYINTLVVCPDTKSPGRIPDEVGVEVSYPQVVDGLARP